MRSPMEKTNNERGIPEKQDKNPLNSVDKESMRISPQIETDKFSSEEQKEIVRMVVQDARSDIDVMGDWVDKKRKDLQMYNGEKPSVIEGLTKKGWQSDRNLRLTTSCCDAFQATLLATCFNVDMLHVKDTEVNDANKKDDIETFSKWGLGPSESNIFNDVSDFIHNRIVQGYSVFEVYWKVWYEWVDRRIPKYGRPILGIIGKKEFKGYEIKTEKVRFEKGIIENVADMDDILMPSYGKSIQDLDHFIRIIHLNGEKILDYIDRNIFTGDIDEDYIDQLKGACFDERIKQLGKEKAQALGIVVPSDITISDMRQFPVDIYAWYGTYEKNGRKEKYRFMIEPTRLKFLAGKPLRKIPGCRNGKIPFVGGPLRRIPGQLRGESLPSLISDCTNAINNTFNQKSDFQYVENCPFGFHKPDENFDKQVYELEPGVSYPSEDPKNINFPNLSRSMAWAEADIRILLEVIERLTGAASYFQARDSQSKTLGQDMLIEKNSETRFGLWVKALIADISEAVNMWLQMYQDCAPTTLGERLLGEDGKKLFPNLSIETLRGGYDVYFSPDIVAGSKAMEKQMSLFALEQAGTNMWFNPQMNPRGSWQMTVDSFKKLGFMNVESYMPPKPPSELGTSKEVDKVWTQIAQGDTPEVNENMNIMELLAGLAKKASEDFYKLDEEYRPNFENYMMKLSIAMRQQMKKAQEDMIANQMASKMVMDNENKIIPNESVPMPPQTPGAMHQMPDGTMMPNSQMPNQGAPSGVPGNPTVPTL